jgi:hypothetical protein
MSTYRAPLTPPAGLPAATTRNCTPDALRGVCDLGDAYQEE